MKPKDARPQTPDPRPAPRGSAAALPNLQAHLESAANAGAKGHAQWYTPVEWAAALALALPNYRPVLVDLTCGTGQLLAGAAAPSTKHTLGCDIENFPCESVKSVSHFVNGDVTQFYGLLRVANFRADCFVLNLPWDHHQYREKLAGLAQSDCPAVEMAFGAHDGRTGKDTIDSTVAGLCIALDRCSPYGEGFVIANEATLQRLIFGGDKPGSGPHGALAHHIWAHLVVPGNICMGSARAPRASSDASSDDFQTGIIWFARSHNRGCDQHHVLRPREREKVAGRPVEGGGDSLLAEAKVVCDRLGKSRLTLRRGSVIRTYEGGHTPDSVPLWDAAREEWRFTHSTALPLDAYNIWLDVDGTIKTNLSTFDQASGRVNKEQYQRLFAINGKHPMQLILQRAERKELERTVFGPSPAGAGEGQGEGCGGSPWRVAPAVTEAVKNALAEYDAIRAPLYPLSQIQRLGYLDDNDDILCTASLSANGVGGEGRGEVVRFHSGRRYQIRTETIRVVRSGLKMNLTGERDAVEWEGSELALFIKDCDGVERLFMEERLRAPEVKLSIQDKGAASPIEFNLLQLIEHFEIPTVPDVSLVHADRYQKNLEALAQIEEIVNN